MYTRTATPTTVQGLVDPDDLICAGCADPVTGEPPLMVEIRHGSPADRFSHLDRTPLCRDRSGRIAEPIEVSR